MPNHRRAIFDGSARSPGSLASGTAKFSSRRGKMPRKQKTDRLVRLRKRSRGTAGHQGAARDPSPVQRSLGLADGRRVHSHRSRWHPAVGGPRRQSRRRAPRGIWDPEPTTGGLASRSERPYREQSRRVPDANDPTSPKPTPRTPLTILASSPNVAPPRRRTRTRPSGATGLSVPDGGLFQGGDDTPGL